MPGLDGTVLLSEDDEEVRPEHFDHALQPLIHHPGFEGFRAILFGGFVPDHRRPHDCILDCS